MKHYLFVNLSAMHKYKFTFDYSGDHLKIRHEESPRFIVTLKDDANHLLEQDIIICSTSFEWIDAAPESETELDKLITQTVQAFNEHEETIKRDIRNAKKDKWRGSGDQRAKGQD